MKVSDLDFDLPESLIALKPVHPRDICRLLVLHRNGKVENKRFLDLPEYLTEGDLLILNDTRVFPAKLAGKKQTGGKIDMLLTRRMEADTWEILSRDRYTGKVSVSDALSGEVTDGRTIRFTVNGKSMADPDVMETLWNIGQMPLPPYIRRDPIDADKKWYQTVYGERGSSIAAPTAGLHFTKELINTLRRKRVIVKFITLNIGTGTFKPVRTEYAEDHIMDSEYFEMDSSIMDSIRETKKSGKRIFSVGTTTTRALEGYANGRYKGRNELSVTSHESANSAICNPQSAIRGCTDIFIHPGYEFRVIDSLITNFHLPRSTPLMLTSALSSIKNIMDVYRSAISMEYRFFSYGDAMLIL